MKVVVRRLEDDVRIKVDDKNWCHIIEDARVEFFKCLKIKGKAEIVPVYE